MGTPANRCKETPTGIGHVRCTDPVCERCHPPLSRHQRASRDLAAFHSADSQHGARAVVPAEWGDYATMRAAAREGLA